MPGSDQRRGRWREIRDTLLLLTTLASVVIAYMAYHLNYSDANTNQFLSSIAVNKITIDSVKEPERGFYKLTVDLTPQISGKAGNSPRIIRIDAALVEVDRQGTARLYQERFYQDPESLIPWQLSEKAEPRKYVAVSESPSFYSLSPLRYVPDPELQIVEAPIYLKLTVWATAEDPFSRLRSSVSTQQCFLVSQPLEQGVSVVRRADDQLG